MELELRINGVIKSLDVAANESLLTSLRQAGYYSVKHGCETGECGACTVLIDGVPRPGCVTFAAQVGGCTLTTVENLGNARKLHPLQEAFIDTGAEATILDSTVAVQLGPDLEISDRYNVAGLGGRITTVPSARVEIQIMAVPELSGIVNALFLDNFEVLHGNLIGLDLLESIDFGLSHRDRIMYFGRPG